MTKLLNSSQAGHILFAYSFDENGRAKIIEDFNVAEELKGKSLTWVHLNGNEKNLKISQKWLETEVSYLDHLIIDALLAQETRPRIIEFAQGILVILRSVNRNNNSDPEDMVSIRMWIDSERIITIQKREMQALFSIKKMVNCGKDIKNSGEFLSILCSQIGEETLLFLNNLSKKTDEIANNIINSSNSLHVFQSLQQELLKLRSQLTIVKRFLKPQKDVFVKLQQLENIDWITDFTKRQLAENQELANLMIEDIEESKERSQIMNDQIANIINAKLNRNMFRLSIVTMIFMPITFITGLFGMNLGGIPGSNHQSFWIITSIILIIGILEIFILKKRQWF